MATELTREIGQTELALEQVSATLSGRSHALDLNLVQSALAVAQQDIVSQTFALSELAELKDNLTSRIRGMQSAIAVANDSADIRSADTAEELRALCATDLIKRYHITCARFRDTFPANLTYLNSGVVSDKKHDWADYRT